MGQEDAVAGIVLFLGIGFGLFSSPNMAAVMGSVSQKHYGTASSLVATMRTQGMLVSMAIVTVVLAHHLGDQPVNTENIARFVQSMQLSLVVFSIISTVGIAFSLGRISRRTLPAQPD